MRRQIVLDKQTDKLLDKLAVRSAGNRSVVVREALHAFADVDHFLDRVEAEPAFQEMMAASDADLRAGRTIPHNQVVRASRAKVTRAKNR